MMCLSFLDERRFNSLSGNFGHSVVLRPQGSKVIEHTEEHTYIVRRASYERCHLRYRKVREDDSEFQ